MVGGNFSKSKFGLLFLWLEEGFANLAKRNILPGACVTCSVQAESVKARKRFPMLIYYNVLEL